MGKPSTTNPPRPHITLIRAFLLAVLALTTPAHPQTQATTLPLLYPWAIAFDSQGNLYFAETANHAIRKVTPAGVLTTVAGNGTQGYSGDSGPATSAQLDSPAGLAIDSAGNLYIADTHNHRIRRVLASTGIITTIAGIGVPGFAGDNAAATSAQLYSPTALALDPLAANLYLADTANHRIRRVTFATGVIATVAGNGTQAFAGDNGPATSASIDSPSGLAVDSANLYIADTHNARIRRITLTTGIIATIAGSASPTGILQPISGDNGPATSATLALPRGLAVDSLGNLYLADSANHRIRIIAATTGTITTAAGQGIQTFAGDNAPAVSASLDSPRSVALSPANLLTLADTGNARIRQLDQLPAPGPDIHTIAGLGITTPTAGVLTLTGPSVVAYGSGDLTATLTTSTLATGAITFLDTAVGTPITLATTHLASDTATLSTSTLSAGLHTILATYLGDATHSIAQSSALTLTITPLALTATPNPASILYGQPIPTLTGTLTGVLPQDATKLSAIFTTPAAALSATGLYPITATLTGPSAPDYTITTAFASLTISKAPTLTTLTPSTITTSPGAPLTLTIAAASTTTGTPTGTITLLDSTTPLSTVPLANATAAYSTSTLALGPHTLTATYSGDTNFLPSTSPTATITVGASSDFTLTPTGATTQAIPSGSTATYNFSVATQGTALSSPIALAVAGVPLGVTSSINPSYIPPGGSVTSFTLTVETPKAALAHPNPTPHIPATPAQAILAVLFIPALALTRRTCFNLRRTRLLTIIIAASTFSLAILLTACGNRVNTAPEFTNSSTYTLTITGTATSPTGALLQHAVTVTLQVLS